MGGSIGVACFHFRAVGMAVREAVISAKAVQMVPDAVLRHASADADSALPDIAPGNGCGLGMVGCFSGAHCFTYQLLQDVHQADETLAFVTFGRVAIVVDRNIMDCPHFFRARLSKSIHKFVKLVAVMTFHPLKANIL